MPPARRQLLTRFAEDHCPASVSSIQPASSDASFRSYWRVAMEGQPPLVIMDAPPDREDIDPWLDIGSRLRAAGLHAPAVLAADRRNGFVLMEDLGVRTFLPELSDGNVDGLYGDALAALLRMQERVDTSGLPPYDRRRLVDELELMPEWFLQRHLGFTPSCEEWDVIEAAFTVLIQAALEQPRAFVHRDYHSRNLLVVRESGIGNRESEKQVLENPGIIDFQDAVDGPITYDLVSLLRDCYIEWPAERVEAWMAEHHQRLSAAGLMNAEVGLDRFRRWFDLMGLQRHLKVLGIFCRLWYRDAKAQYLGDLPMVWRYALDVANRYPELAALAELLERARAGRDLAEARRELPA
ncbi:MAG: phosphotransferase [Xanthomonadales bacterium]|nr:phosphotransferase [Xanthomonadales bacterium]